MHVEPDVTCRDHNRQNINVRDENETAAVAVVGMSLTAVVFVMYLERVVVI